MSVLKKQNTITKIGLGVSVKKTNYTKSVRRGSTLNQFLLILLMLLLFIPSETNATHVTINSSVDVKFDLYKNIIYGNDDGFHSLGYGYQDDNLILMTGLQEIEDKTPKWYLDFKWKHEFPYGIKAGVYICQRTELNLDYKITEKLYLNLNLGEKTKTQNVAQVGIKYLL